MNLFRYNPNYISKMFSKYFGVPLKNYVQTERVNAVKNLLLSSTYTVKEVAEMLSFSDTNSLIKFFVFHTNTSPTEYRDKFYGIHTNKK